MSDPHSPRSAADRNLLFGILALQMDFITQAALVSAMNAWVLDKTKPLGQLLLEQGALTAADRELLEGVVRRHLEKHGHDAERSLAAVHVDAAVRADLERIADVDLHATIGHARPPTPSADSVGQGTTDYQAAPGLRFRILRPHARGGLGEVFVARDEELNREVALKEIQARHADSAESRARFLREAEITGGLEHPGIVPVYGLGAYPDGRPFYAMRFIKGKSLKDAIARFHKSSPTDNLAFRQLLTRFIATCNAVAYAHSRGVLHRDLKPSNIMLGDYGETLVVDWGLARTRGQATADSTPVGNSERPLRLSATGDSELTQTGQALGTPAYMSPEQAAGRLDQLGPASDVYSLGATLYCLLTGQAPFAESDVGVALQKVQRGEFPPPRQRSPQVPRALEAVCLKAMALRPQDRYPSARALADDLEHWLADEAVTAYRERPAERLGRWVRRHKGLVGTAAAACVIGATVTVAALLVRAATERETKEQELRGIAENERAETQKQRDLARRYLYFSRMRMADRAWQEARVDLMEDLLEEQRPERTGNEDLRGFEWYYLGRLRHNSLYTLQGYCVAFSPDGTRLASALGDGTLKLWDVRAGGDVLTLKRHTGPVRSVVFSPDGRRLASVGRDFAVMVWDLETGQETLTLNGQAVAFSPDGQRLVLAAETVKVLDARTGKEILAVQGQGGVGSSLALSPDGGRFASGDALGVVKVWNAQTGQVVFTRKAHVNPVMSAAFSPDGRRLASASSDGTARVWDAHTGREQLSLPENSRQVMCITFSPDGRFLASGGFDRMVKVWDARTGQELLTLRGHAGNVQSVAFSPDGRCLASADSDGTVKLWDARIGQDVFVQENDWINSVAFSPDGERLATASRNRTVKLWDARTGQEVLAFRRHTNAILSVVFSPDGQRLASAGYDSTVRVWDARTAQELLAFKAHPRALQGGRDAAVTSVAFSPDGRRLASSGFDNTVRVWDAQTGREQLVFKGHPEWMAKGHASWVEHVAFSPDGERLASAGKDGTVKVWDARTGQEQLSLEGYGMAFSPDGRRLATTLKGAIGVWDAQTGQEVLTLKGHTETAVCVVFSPDGQRLASVSLDMVTVWDARTGQEALTLQHPGMVRSVAFSPDGRRLASAGLDGQVRVWDATPITEQSSEEARAVTCYRFLAERLVLEEAIIESLRQDQTISEGVRQRALVFAKGYRESVARLNEASWTVVRYPGATETAYRLALRQAEAACRLRPENSSLLNTLGVAQYRLGRYAEALKTLTHADQLNVARDGRSIPADLVFLAMTYQRLGKDREAVAALARLQAMTVKEPAGDEEPKSLLREAEALILEPMPRID